jgi:hypothetical protein
MHNSPPCDNGRDDEAGNQRVDGRILTAVARGLAGRRTRAADANFGVIFRRRREYPSAQLVRQVCAWLRRRVDIKAYPRRSCDIPLPAARSAAVVATPATARGIAFGTALRSFRRERSVLAAIRILSRLSTGLAWDTWLQPHLFWLSCPSCSSLEA